MLSSASAVTALDFASEGQPIDTEDIVRVIKDLPMPLLILLSDLLSSEDLPKWNSIRCAYLFPVHNAYKSNFPTWIVTYWVEVSHLQRNVSRPWNTAVNFLQKAQNTWKTPGV